MSGLSDKLRAHLQSAGWSDSRKADIRPFERALEEEGYPVHESVVVFLRSFGGIAVAIPEQADRVGAVDFRLDPREAIDLIYRERVSEEYDLRVGSPLCAVGVYFGRSIVLLMDADGGVYGGSDDFLVRLGSSGEEALETLYRGSPVATIPPLSDRRR
jgi:hypothetical protein